MSAHVASRPVTLACLEAAARAVAAELGLQPRTQLVYFTDLAAFRAAQRPADRPARDGVPGRWLRGECSRGTKRGQRLIYIAPELTAPAWWQTATHETAHGLTPWRQHHSAVWLALHVGTLQRVSGPAHARAVEAEARARYGLEAG